MADHDSSSDIGNCGICVQPYDVTDRIPKLLACHHTLCLFCAYKLASGGTIKCPICRRVTKLQPSGVPGLQTNFYLQHMPSRRCDVIKRPTGKCSLHGKVMNFYCDSHTKAVCCQCLLLSHNKEHCEVKELVDVKVAMQQQLTNQIAEVETEISDFKQQLEKIGISRGILAASKEVTKAKVDEIHNGYMQQLSLWSEKEKARIDVQYKEVEIKLNKAEREVKADLDRATGQKKKYCTAIDNLDAEKIDEFVADSQKNGKPAIIKNAGQNDTNNIHQIPENVQIQYIPPDNFSSYGDILMTPFSEPTVRDADYPDVIVEGATANVTFQISPENHVVRDDCQVSVSISGPNLGFVVCQGKTCIDSKGRHVTPFHVTSSHDAWQVVNGSHNVGFKTTISWRERLLHEEDFTAEVVMYGYESWYEN
ncbi:E3 ubiquitin-protein ligase TRIM7 [Lingula anatina]|uniref:E3 ubiquitin-protein ligase TRIM7 n=1 Tax=Lingula anatina TaxID=7574 RepID=A0A1S3HW79_LINAN|nr:E3 ubiquitin-protein ligase TRIM7 [Lingula anatina]|eukprot:XP_013390290.1 E3 ubiquitin-protein ligase TRIM7 [Lingula anatina]